METQEIKRRLEIARQNDLQTPLFIALALTEMDIYPEDGKEGLQEIKDYLEEIGMSTNYAFQLRSLLKVPDVLEGLGYTIIKGL